MKISLNQNFALRQSLTESFLQNIETGATYKLESDQTEFIRLLDGTISLVDIFKLYDVQSQRKIKKFLDKLSAVKATSNDGTRKFACPVPNPRLEAVHFEPSGICNMRCAHCYQGVLIKDKSTLPLPLIINLLNEMVDLQISSISLSGGEPFKTPKIESILTEIDKRNFYFSALFTNGLLVDEKCLETLKTLRYKVPLYVSLDSLPGEKFLFRGFRGKTAKIALETIVRNIKTMVQEGFRVTVNTVVNTENIDILEKMHELMKNTGVSNWRLGFPKMTPNFKKNQQFSADWNKIAERCFAILKQHFQQGQPFPLQVEYMYRDVLFEQGLPKLVPDDYVCDYEGRRHEINIKPNGDVVSCAYCNELPIGNVYKQSLGEIWYSEEMQRVKMIKISDVEKCRGCNLIPLCGTGCRANAFFLHGDFFNSRDDYACHAVKFFDEKVLPFLEKNGVI